VAGVNDRNFDQLLNAWMELGPSSAPDRVADAARLEARATRQTVTLRWSATRRIRLVRSTVGRLGLAAAAIVTAAIIGLDAVGEIGIGSSPSQDAPTVLPSGDPLATSTSSVPSAAATPLPADVLQGPDAGGSHTVRLGDIDLSFSVPSSNWEAHGRPYISKSTSGPQDAEAIIYWGRFPEGLSAEPCADVLDPSAGSSVAALAEAVASAPGTDLITVPTDVIVDGHAAKSIVVAVRVDHLGCNPGFFYSWQPFLNGALWPETMFGDTIRVWIVDVDGTIAFIAGATRPDAGSGVVEEIQQVIESIRFD
jgi:hypothetical protein